MFDLLRDIHLRALYSRFSSAIYLGFLLLVVVALTGAYLVHPVPRAEDATELFFRDICSHYYGSAPQWSYQGYVSAFPHIVSFAVVSLFPPENFAYLVNFIVLGVNLLVATEIYRVAISASKGSAFYALLTALAVFFVSVGSPIYLTSLMYSIWPIVMLCLMANFNFITADHVGRWRFAYVIVINVVALTSTPVYLAVIVTALLASTLWYRKSILKNGTLGCLLLLFLIYFVFFSDSNSVSIKSPTEYVSNIPKYVFILSKQLSVDILRVREFESAHFVFIGLNILLLYHIATNFSRIDVARQRLLIYCAIAVIALTGLVFVTDRYDRFAEHFLTNWRGARYFDVQRGLWVLVIFVFLAGLQKAQARWLFGGSLLVCVLTVSLVSIDIWPASDDHKRVSTTFITEARKIGTDDDSADIRFKWYWGNRTFSVQNDGKSTNYCE